MTSYGTTAMLATLPSGWCVIASQIRDKQWQGADDAALTMHQAHGLRDAGLLIMSQRRRIFLDGYDLVVQLTAKGKLAVAAVGGVEA